MIDSHAHILSEFYDNIDEIVHMLKEKQLLCVMNCATSLDSSKEVIKLSKEYQDFLIPSIGIHPESVEEIGKLTDLEILIKDNNIKAIGEIGLDYYWVKDNKDKQLDLFNKQLDLAEKYNLPIIVHTRDSIQDTFNTLKNRKLKGVIHCYSGSYEMAKEFVKLGYKLGIGGVLTFKNSKLHEVIEKIELKDIILETDSPFLSPEPVRGTKNTPYNVYYVAQKISEIKGISFENVIDITTKNSRELFDL